MSDVEVSSISIGIGASAGMLIAVSPMLYASVISAFGQQRVRNTSSGNIRQGPLWPRFAYSICNVWLAEQSSPASPRTLSLVPPPLSLLACCKIRTNPHLCRTWLAGTASRRWRARRRVGRAPVAVALGPPVEEASTTVHHK